MLRNYFKTSVRSLLRYKGYSLINIFGLTIGLATCIFIFLWVSDELSYDKFHANDKRIYRILNNWVYRDKVETGWSTPVRLAEVIKADAPEIDQVVRMSWSEEVLFKYESKSILSEGYYADSTLFKVFSFPIVQGDASRPLPNISAIAISSGMAKKMFGNADPIGKILHADTETKHDYKVTAVFSDQPKNSTLKFDYIISFEVLTKERPWALQWGNNVIQTYVMLAAAADPEKVNAEIKNTVRKQCKDCLNEVMIFQNSKLRLHSLFKDGRNAGGKISYVYSIAVVALLVLVIACINFMNIATARAATRTREIGVRKVVGAGRGGIIVQFLGESLLLSVFALLMALLLVQTLLPLFNVVANKSLVIDFSSGLFLAGILGITLLCGLIAGSYPSLFLSSFKPAAVLKGNPQSALTGNSLRKILVVIQFVVSAVLIVGSVVVYRQISYIQGHDLGFERDNVVVLNQFQGVAKNQRAFRNYLLEYPGVKRVSFSGADPFNIQNTTTDPEWPGKNGEQVSFKVIMSDYDFIPTMGMKLMSGRNFSDIENDTSNYIINEKAMDVMGLTPENAVGTPVSMWRGKGKIIGVTSNFNSANLKEPVSPLIFVNNTTNTYRIFVKIQGNPADAVAHIEKGHKKFDPDYPFSYAFLDENFDKEYRSEATIGNLSLSFTVITILISCLGLFGLASFTAERRTKEFGVRKVLGASVSNLIVLLCREFATLVFIALVAAFPIAWYLSKAFLDQYQFHTQISTDVFLITAVGVFCMAMLTVSYHSVRAASSNPVDSLHNE